MESGGPLPVRPPPGTPPLPPLHTATASDSWQFPKSRPRQLCTNFPWTTAFLRDEEVATSPPTTPLLLPSPLVEFAMNLG